MSFSKQTANRRMASLVGHHALITGGSRGIGAAIARELCSKGARVTILSNNPALLEEKVNELNSEYPLKTGRGQHDYISYDLTCATGIESHLREEQHWKQFTSANILINCAGLTQTSLLMSTSAEDISNIMNVNLLSPIVLCKLFVKNALRQKRSSAAAAAAAPAIVNVASIVGTPDGANLVGSTVYTSSKAALSRFSAALQSELRAIAARRPGGAAGVLAERVLCVHPGLVAETAIGQSVLSQESGPALLPREEGGAVGVAQRISHWLADTSPSSSP